MYNNQFVTAYVINSDIPQEWFTGINQQINKIGNRIIDIKIHPDLLSHEYSPHDYINNLAYGRFLIPQLINDDRVIYLDTDVIVNDNISNLNDIQWGGNELFAAVKEINDPNTYNDGVLVFNNRVLKQQAGLVDKLLKLGQDNHLQNGDQSLFNEYFKGKIRELSLTYNYEAGMDRIANYQHQDDVTTSLNSLDKPKIIHFDTNDKPWNLTSSGRMRRVWWRYYHLSWDQITRVHSSNARLVVKQHYLPLKGSLLTFTYDQELEHFEELVKSLPEWQFNVAAPTYMGWDLIKMLSYPNVRLYPMVTTYHLSHLIKNANAYLDINHGTKNVIVENLAKQHKPIFAFSNYNVPELDKYEAYHIIDDSDVTGFIKQIKSLS